MIWPRNGSCDHGVGAAQEIALIPSASIVDQLALPFRAKQLPVDTIAAGCKNTQASSKKGERFAWRALEHFAWRTFKY
jgi:hypothetical protein